jgi:hypothetical protein
MPSSFVGAYGLIKKLNVRTLRATPFARIHLFARSAPRADGPPRQFDAFRAMPFEIQREGTAGPENFEFSFQVCTQSRDFSVGLRD